MAITINAYVVVDENDRIIMIDSGQKCIRFARNNKGCTAFFLDGTVAVNR